MNFPNVTKTCQEEFFERQILKHVKLKLSGISQDIVTIIVIKKIVIKLGNKEAKNDKETQTEDSYFNTKNYLSKFKNKYSICTELAQEIFFCCF